MVVIRKGSSCSGSKTDKAAETVMADLDRASPQNILPSWVSEAGHKPGGVCTRLGRSLLCFGAGGEGMG